MRRARSVKWAAAAGGADLGGGGLEQLQPAVEMTGVDGQGQVFGHRPPVIGPAHQGHGRPEQPHLCEVRAPVRYPVGEDGADQRIGADAVVKGVDEAGDHGLVYAGLGLDTPHGGQASGFWVIGLGHGAQVGCATPFRHCGYRPSRKSPALKVMTQRWSPLEASTEQESTPNMLAMTLAVDL